jgi:hypothetical protein
MRSYKAVERTRAKVAQLKAEFDECLVFFEQACLFTGPSLYFHLKTLALRSRHATPLEVISDSDFFDSLYATLTAWGMHRMGRGHTKLLELPEIKSSFESQAELISELPTVCLSQLDKAAVDEVAAKLWAILARLRVGIGETKIVANSKALHHLVPSLMPPIDREYTLRFFFDRKDLNQGDERAFREMFPYFCELAASQKEHIQGCIGRGMNTSETKILDNAIVGFRLRQKAATTLVARPKAEPSKLSSTNLVPQHLPLLVGLKDSVPLFKLTLEKTYFNNGFFNVKTEFDSFVRRSEGPVELVLGKAGLRIVGHINRSANRNGAARILGGRYLRDWFQANHSLGDVVDVGLSSPDSIRIG